ncbi:MAG: hypothetical protein D6E12_01105 [Desulfovibrio sp.]|nr:MAG: hypothetical protein D6E12_01105 [Desulfovibrio sp.]
MHGVQRYLALAFLVLAVFSAAWFPRYYQSLRHDYLSWDEAQYAGAARDFLQYGAFEERTHSEALFHFLPLGYPALIVAWVKLTGASVHDAALMVNVALGALLAVFAAGFLLHATRSWFFSLVGGLLVAWHGQLVALAGRPMSDTAYMACSLLMVWLLFAFFSASKWRRFPLVCLGLGLLFSAMYLVRISALYLVPGVPLMLLVGWYLKRRQGERVRWFWTGLGVYVLLCAITVGGTAYRLSILNGYFTVTPQVAANLATGDLRNRGQLEIFDLNAQGTQVNWAGRNQDEPGLVSRWVNEPGTRLTMLAKNVETNMGFLWNATWVDFDKWKPLAPVGFGLVLVLGAIAAWSKRKERPWAERFPPGEGRRLLAALGVLGAFITMHVLAYSLLSARARYMGQVMALVMLLVVLILHVVLGLSNEHQDAPRNKPRFDFNLTRLFVLSLIMVGLLVLFKPLLGKCLSPFPVPDRSAQNDTITGIRSSAQESGRTPIIVYDNSSIPYYCEGYGILVPYTEEDPVLLAKYIRHYDVEFVSVGYSTGFNSETVFNIAMWGLLRSVGQQFPDMVSFEATRYFHVHSFGVGSPVVQGESFPEQGLNLEPGAYLLQVFHIPGNANSSAFVLEDKGRAVQLKSWDYLNIEQSVNQYITINAVNATTPLLRQLHPNPELSGFVVYPLDGVQP